MQDCSTAALQGESTLSTGHPFTRGNKQYAAFGDFGLLYEIPICVSQPGSLDFASLLGFEKLENSNYDESVHHAMPSAWSHATGQLFQ